MHRGIEFRYDHESVMSPSGQLCDDPHTLLKMGTGNGDGNSFSEASCARILKEEIRPDFLARNPGFLLNLENPYQGNTALNPASDSAFVDRTPARQIGLQQPFFGEQ